MIKKAPVNGAFLFASERQAYLVFTDGSIEAELDGAHGKPCGSGELAGVHLSKMLLDEGLFFVGGFALGNVE
ncbi:MAG: hypothetical protein HGB04_01660 [Chlorobiaceae bacterium]|nr:hypothetical protein [Chlorobiaceae bacterium]